MNRIAIFLPLLSLSAAADPATNAPPVASPPDAVIRIAGVSAATNAVATLVGHLGRPAVPAERLPYPGQMARLTEHVLGDTLADEPAHLLVWIPESADGSVPPSVLWMLPVEDAAPGEPGTAWTKPFGSGMVVRRDRLLMLAMDEPRARFAAGDGPERAVESARFEPDGAVLQAVLREPARFAGLRDGMLAKRKEFHADAARLRERAAAGEDVEDELRWAGHMEEHAVFEEAIGDMVFSLLDATESTRLSLDCDNVHGLVFTRVLDGIGPPEDFPAERIPLRSFLAENLPFLAETPESKETVLCGETWVGPDGGTAVGTRTDLWMFPPATLRALLPALQSLGPTHIGPPESPESAAAAPAPAQRPPDRDRTDGADTDSDGLPDSVELEKWNTDPDNPDTDGDGLRDGDEATKYHTDPCNPDTDADGLRDGDEVNEYRTDPNNPDTDGDGVWDGAEILKYKTNPLNPDTQSPQSDSHAESAESESHAESAVTKPHAVSAEGF
ncbi:MAG: hypothetical protein II839_09970 [Kiritimatiellae bacterium]|nr:hypothetical protein [Kiritimatiellia bacterium]